MRARLVLPIALLCSLALVAVACSGDDGSDASSSSSSGGKKASVPFDGTNWALTDRSDLGVALGGVAVTASFNDSAMSGSSGCNTYGAPIARDDPKVEITGAIATTQIACVGPADSVEQAYLKMLPDVRTYAISGEQLTLKDLGGKALLVYRASGVSDIVGGWVVTSLYTGTAIQSVVGGATLTAEFARDQVSGESGCNSFSGPATIGRTAIRLGPLASTLRACADAALGTQERHYLAALTLARTYEVKGGRLTLFRQGGTIAASFERA
jgi:heat shock protein HslJ